ncbi:MAG: SPOR domain-containing protein [Nitrosomonadales bacterium]|nr:SPOR domain-containing protein [Nitrosomonadales bacterium]
MMKALFWIVLLVNVTFFAVMRWGGFPLTEGPQPVAQAALNEEKIRLLNPASGSPDRAVPGSAPQATATIAEAAPPTVKSNAAEPKANNLVCLEWGDFSGNDLTRATTALSAMQLGNKLGQRQIEHNIGYWVYIPPLKDKAAISQKLAQLKARGVEEFFVVPDAGPWLNAISLGVFKTQEAAQKFVDALRAKDVRSAQIGERASKLKATIFVLQGVDNAVASKLAALQKDFAGSVINNIPCTGTKQGG